MRFLTACCLLVTVFWSLVCIPPAFATPALAMGTTPKYPADFTHFDYANPNAPKGGTLALSAIGSFDTLNPFALKGISAQGLNGLKSGLVFESLMTSSDDEPFTLYGVLAEEVSLAADGLSVTFRLNPRARFSDGSPVTVENVKFSFDTLMSETAHPMYRFYWADVKNCEILDEQRVRFNFARKNRELHLIISEVPVFSPHWLHGRTLEKVSLDIPIGSGPYVVDSFDLGKYIIYRRNPEHWAKDLNVYKGLYNFDRLHYKYYKDQIIALEALKAGEFDFMDINISKQWARDLRGAQFDNGNIVTEQLSHQNNAGMQAFVFNLRRPLFQDIRVRQAINLAFDFAWTNKNLFFGQYTRCDSYFSNTPLAAPKALPQGEELALLEQFRAQLPEELFKTVWQPVSTEAPHSLRDNLRQAKHLLDAAGWHLPTGGQVLEKDGKKLEIEVLLASPAFERVIAPFARNLEKLGIKMTSRTLDPSLYTLRVKGFEFDMLVNTFAQSLSPGNEQRDYWHSSSANKEDSRNVLGLQNPVVDALVEKLITADNEKSLHTSIHALDRVLLFGEYVVPNWYINAHRVAYWKKLKRPQTLPLYYSSGEDVVIKTWWQAQPK